MKNPDLVFAIRCRDQPHKLFSIPVVIWSRRTLRELALAGRDLERVTVLA